MSDRLFFDTNVLLDHLHACAVRTGATHLVTRDLAGFRRSEVPVMNPDMYLAGLSKD